MGAFMSKLSLYDIFSMLIPGGIIMFAFLMNIECLHSFLLTYINGHDISISSIASIIVSTDSIGYFYIVLSTLFIILSLCIIRYWNKGDIIYAKIIKNEYYKAYYYIQQKSKNTDISVIEGQVAFLQSMLLPLALMITLPNTILIPSSYGVIRLVLFIIFLIIFPIIYNRIRKIHSRVWEDYNFLHDQSNIKKL